MAAANPQKLGIGEQLKTLRTARSLSQRDLADLSGLSASMICKIESGQSSPTVMSLHKLLEAMNVGLHEFFLAGESDDPSQRIVFPRSGMLAARDPEHVWYHAFPDHPRLKAQVTIEEYQPHTQVLEIERHRRDLCGVVVSGELTLNVDGRGVFTCRPGDAFYLPAGLPHTAANEGDQLLTLIAFEPS
jgi:transcriptional regulator with XRE-family HTH domain